MVDKEIYVIGPISRVERAKVTLALGGTEGVTFFDGVDTENISIGYEQRFEDITSRDIWVLGEGFQNFVQSHGQYRNIITSAFTSAVDDRPIRSRERTFAAYEPTPLEGIVVKRRSEIGVPDHRDFSTRNPGAFALGFAIQAGSIPMAIEALKESKPNTFNFNKRMTNVGKALAAMSDQLKDQFGS